MRLDHIAYRVADRNKTVQFFIEAFGYKIQQKFKIKFDDNSEADCIALEPPEKIQDQPWTVLMQTMNVSREQEYHLAPEIFVSDGTSDSIVGKWVAARNGIGGIHHIAYQVESVKEMAKEWKEKGYAEFSSEKPIVCDELTQIFTKPSELTGVIYEFIKRGEHGFCRDSVKYLMESSKDNK